MGSIAEQEVQPDQANFPPAGSRPGHSLPNDAQAGIAEGISPPAAARPGAQVPGPDRARRMRWSATGMLVLMAVVFLWSRQFVDLHPGWGYVNAFAEAAMVGGLADWFAVTALFRHPLGIPLPHTAIIPQNKDRSDE